ncbi:hypothetical protein JB92DRAFT_2773819, partial [Gautieria morchelliformis]
DDTIVRVFGRIFAPPSSKILMDVTSIVPYPGDPASDNYEENIPNDTSVAIWGVGAVVNNAEYGADSKTRLFDLAVSDYCFQIQSPDWLFFRCIYDGNSVQWNRTPAPNVNTAIYFYGLLKDVNDQGNLSIVVDNVVLNLGAGTLNAAPTGRLGSHRGPKGRSRRFAAPVVEDDDQEVPINPPRRSASPLWIMTLCL